MTLTTLGLGHQSPAARQLRTQWIRSTMFGEFWGFAPPALTGATLMALDASSAALIVGLTLAGIVEGVVLGKFQADVLREWIPTVGDWIPVTALSAGLAWLAGMGGSQLVQSAGTVGLLIAGPLWLIGLCCMGSLQARQLRLAVGRSGHWFPIATIAWLIGVAIPVLGLSIIPSTWPVAVHAIVAVAAAMVMGATVGTITARPLMTLVPTHQLIDQPTLAPTQEPPQ